MKYGLAFGLLFSIALSEVQTAKDYYNELYQAGGLDRMADQYACFDDGDLKTFFIVAKSDGLRQLLQENDGLRSLSKNNRRALDRGFLIMRGYDRGTPLSSEQFFDKDGETWVSEPNRLGDKFLRQRLSIVWPTLRYKRSVEVLNERKRLISTTDRYGRCEETGRSVSQHGQ